MFRVVPAPSAQFPIIAIDLQAQLVFRDLDAGAGARRAAAKIRDESHSQLRMIATLLDITKADEGQLAPVLDDIDLRALIAEVVETMNVHAVERTRVFERFETSATTRSSRGLGLAFCKLAVEAHGGRIWIEEASPGAAFCVWIGDAA